MTQQVYNLDWYAGNETVKYPIDSKASFIPTGYDYTPQELFGVITDISFNLSSTLSEEDSQPYLSALTITKDLLSLVINVGDTPVFAFSSTQRSLYINRYYTLTSFVDNCSGVITFGEAAKTHKCSYKFASAAQAGFLPSVYHYSMNYPVTSIGKQNGALKYQKDVLFKGIGDVQVNTDIITVDNQSCKAIVFSLVNPEETSPRYLGPCDKRPESETCTLPSLERINSIIPNGNGNINITCEGLKIKSSPGLLLLSSDYTLDDICVDDRAETMFGEDECCDTCYTDEEGNEIDPPAGSTPSSTICNGSSVQHINFNTDVFASGIAIDENGITPIEDDDTVYLTINKLSNLKYFSITTSRPKEGGFCAFSIVLGDYPLTTVWINPTEVTWNESYTLFDRTTYLYPREVTVEINHCKDIERIFADDREIAGFGHGTERFTIAIRLKRCSITRIAYIHNKEVA